MAHTKALHGLERQVLIEVLAEVFQDVIRDAIGVMEAACTAVGRARKDDQIITIKLPIRILETDKT